MLVVFCIEFLGVEVVVAAFVIPQCQEVRGQFIQVYLLKIEGAQGNVVVHDVATLGVVQQPVDVLCRGCHLAVIVPKMAEQCISIGVHGLPPVVGAVEWRWSQWSGRHSVLRVP